MINLINKLKQKTHPMQNAVGEYEYSQIDNKEMFFEIELSKEKDFFKMKISDYISIVDYVERMRQIDNFGLEHLISNAVLWNSGKQKVNKGLYYVTQLDNRLYNILIEENNIRIDERIKINEITEEKIVFLDTENNDYSYTFHKHDITGNTFYTRYFNKRGISFGKLNLSKDDFSKSINLLIHNLENIDTINDIIDLELLKECISRKKVLKKV